MSDAYPKSEDAERSILGGCMLDPSRIAEVADAGLTAAHFWREDHGRLWEVLIDMFARNVPIDLVTIGERVQRDGAARFGGMGYVVGLTRGVPSTANLAYYAGLVVRAARARQVLDDLAQKQEALMRGGGDVVGDVLDDLAQLTAEAPIQRGGWRSLADVAREVVDETARAHLDGDDAPQGLSTGMPELDEAINYLCAPDLVLIAARPRMGKTSLAIQIGEHVAGRYQRPVAVFSLEMKDTQLGHRSLTAASGIEDGRKFRRGGWAHHEIEALADAAERNADGWRHLYIDHASALRASQVRTRAQRLKRKAGDLALVILDYIQLLKPEDSRASRDAQVGEMSRTLKTMALELDCPVIALSQLNRDCDKRQNKRPVLADLRESGNLEQDADAVLFVYREEVYDEYGELTPEQRKKAEILIAKCRTGGGNVVHCQFDHNSTRFHSTWGESVIALD